MKTAVPGEGDFDLDEGWRGRVLRWGTDEVYAFESKFEKFWAQSSVGPSACDGVILVADLMT